jgi:hypothetical protein
LVRARTAAFTDEERQRFRPVALAAQPFPVDFGEYRGVLDPQFRLAETPGRCSKSRDYGLIVVDVTRR